MREKKIRGLKRKTINMIHRIEEHTTEFLTDFYNGYLHLPVAESFINSIKTPSKVKKLCFQTLIDRANYLNHNQ